MNALFILEWSISKVVVAEEPHPGRAASGLGAKARAVAILDERKAEGRVRSPRTWRGGR